MRKKNNAEGIVLSDFKQNWKAMSIKIVWYWLKNRHIDQWNRIEISEINPQIFSQLLYDKEARNYNGEGIVSWFYSWVGKIPWRRDRLPTPVFLGFPGSSDSKESACNVGDQGSIPGLGRSPGEGKGLPTPVFCPGDFHGVAKSQTRLSHFTFTFR